MNHGDAVSPHRTRLAAAQRRETIPGRCGEVFGEAGYRAAKVADVAADIGQALIAESPAGRTAST